MRPVDPRRGRPAGPTGRPAAPRTDAAGGGGVGPALTGDRRSGGILARNRAGADPLEGAFPAPVAAIDPPASRTEHDEQCFLLVWVRANLVRYPDLEMLTAVPHAEQSKRQAGRKWAEGVSAGYPDLLLDAPRAGWHGLRIEMKRPRYWPARRSEPLSAGLPSPAQDAWRHRLARRGFVVATCWRWESARAVLLWWLGLPTFVGVPIRRPEPPRIAFAWVLAV